MSAKRCLLSLFMGLSVLLASPANGAEECSQEMLMSYYPEPFVAQTLERFQVPEEKRAGIQQMLAQKDQEVVSTVEQKAEGMDPNPLKDPKLREQAVMIFRETLYDLFSNAMNANGINDKEQIQNMLDDIQMQKAKQFAACMKQFRPENPPQSTPPPEPNYPGQSQDQGQYPGDNNQPY